MGVQTSATAWQEIEAFIEAFEQQHAGHGEALLEDYLPDARHPLYQHVLRELIRVDLEFSWESGSRKKVDDYLATFPDLRQQREALQQIAFEEYRLRQRAGEDPSPVEYESRFGVSTKDWPTAPVAKSREDSEAAANMQHAAAAYLECSRKSARPIIQDVEESVRSALAGKGEAQLFLDLHRDNPATAERLARAVTSWPREGAQFLGFELIKELGRGAFARVYLARQGDLTNRYVALKVSSDIFAESQTLAQLQHTNIVPIYSAHHTSPFLALCMPYLGSTTLADVLRELGKLPAVPASSDWLRRLVEASPSFPAGYVQAVLWLTTGLARGLAHAHERGIVHRDVKPANILLSDEGQPLLLDFNVSEDIKVQVRASAAYVGGTLPYMAPEHLVAFRDGAYKIDARGDIYALGIILYELLTGKSPFPIKHGVPTGILSRMIDERQLEPPSMRMANKAVTPAVESIVRRCLAADHSRRYQSAREVLDDLERQQADLPLQHAPNRSPVERARKWGRRHPRLVSVYGVGAVLLVLLAMLGSLYGLRVRQLNRAEALNTLHAFREEMKTTRFLLGSPSPSPHELAQGAALARQALNRYNLPDRADWSDATVVASLPQQEREELYTELGEILLTSARAASRQALSCDDDQERQLGLGQALRLNSLAESAFGGQNLRSIQLQRALILNMAGRTDEAQTVLKKAESLPITTARDYLLLAEEEIWRGAYRQARSLLTNAKALEPQNAFVYYALGRCYAGMADYDKAAAALDTSIALWPKFHGSYYWRGAAYAQLKDYKLALSDFDEAIRLRSDFLPARLDRALLRNSVSDFPGALEDLNYVLGEDPGQTRAYFIRATVRARAGDERGARQDLEQGMQRKPDDELSWIARGLARLSTDPKGCLADLDEALKINPRSQAALEDKAHVLAEKMGRTEEAIKVLDQAIALYPDYVAARAGRGVLLARLGRRNEALRDAEHALRLDSGASNLYQVAGIYALTSRLHTEDRFEAIRLLTAALRGGFGYDLLAGDHDLDPIRSDAQFRHIVDAAEALRAANVRKAAKGQ